MYAVGRLGSYITQGVYSVSGSFHPFGGAVDIIVVEQPDGSFKSSPWYVRFGKFQGVLKAREKVVHISVNGVDANFYMHLDQRGEAYFLREVEAEEGDSILSAPSSSDEMDGQSQEQNRPMNSKTNNYVVTNTNSSDKIDGNNGKVMARTNSHRSRILGLVFGRRSRKEGVCREADENAGVVRRSSLDRAEIAADLLEVKWSTNLATTELKKDHTSQFSASNILEAERDKVVPANDEESQMSSSVSPTIGTGMGHCVSAEETSSSNVNIVNRSPSDFENLELTDYETSVEMLDFETLEQVVQTSTGEEIILKEINGLISANSMSNDETSLLNTDFDESAEGVVHEVTNHDPRIPDVIRACPGENLEEELASDEGDAALTDFGISEEESGSEKTQSFICFETAETSIMGLNDSSKRTCETVYVPGGGQGDANLCGEKLHATDELLPEVLEDSYQNLVIQQAEDMELETKVCDDYPQQTNPSSCIDGPDEVDHGVPLTVSKSCTQMVIVDSAEVVESTSIPTIFSFSSSNHQIQVEKSVRNEIITNELQPSSDCVGDSEQFQGVCGPTKAASIPVSETSEEDQFLFSDLDEVELKEIQDKSNFPVDVNEGNRSSCCPKGVKEVNGSLSANDGSYSSPEKLVEEENQLPDLVNFEENSKMISRAISIPRVHGVAGVEFGRMANSLPCTWSHIESMDADGFHSLSHSADTDGNSLEWTMCYQEESCCANSESDNHPLQELSNDEAFQNSNLKSDVANPAVGDPSKGLVTSGGSWGLWPFYFKKSRSRKTMQLPLSDTTVQPPLSDTTVHLSPNYMTGQPTPNDRTMQATLNARSFVAENDSDRNDDTVEDKKVFELKVRKHLVRAICPTSEQLASLNLKEGRNVVTFTFSTAMLGKQQVDARIFLWKWNTRIVISDVDGTITKSDVLGQFMPLVGVDWSQTGVAHLFSAIKENGYQLLFLSARAISQAYLTRQFLVNLKQDGKALPDGPVVISPDGLFPSLFREVIRRAPHEFKIACLEDIRALFPSDCNPFYAGFGNRDTDEISYLKVGIPRGKIFIINPKGEVAVNRLIDTRSYTSLHTLVHGMFPSGVSFEQEDFNSWNFWKLPPPMIDG